MIELTLFAQKPTNNYKRENSEKRNMFYCLKVTGKNPKNQN